MLDERSVIAGGRMLGVAPREAGRGVVRGVVRGGVREALHEAVRAPAAADRERWICCVRDGGVLEMYVDRICVPSGVDPAGRESIIDCGAALLRLCVALRALGYAARVDLLPDRAQPDLLARVTLDASRTPTPADQAMVAAIAPLRTDGTGSSDRTIAPHVRPVLMRSPGDHHVGSLRKSGVRVAALCDVALGQTPTTTRRLGTPRRTSRTGASGRSPRARSPVARR